MSTAPQPLRLLHRRLAAGMGLASLAAFISGAGLDTPAPLVAAAALVLSLFWAPGARLQRILDPTWRVVALMLAARALYNVVLSPDDIVLPMVDLLLVLLVSENLKEHGEAGDTRVYSLSFALLIAACAYRPGFVFALSFIAYCALSIVALMVGHLIRKLNEHEMREVRLERPFLLRVASLSIIMLVLSAVVFAAFPRVSHGWVIRGTQNSSSVVGFGDRVSLAEHGGRIYPNPEVVLRIEFPEGKPQDVRDLHWRGRSYDFFDGVAWDRSPGLPRTAPTTGFYATRWPGRRMVARIYAAALDIPVLFGIQPVLDVQPHSAIRAMQDNVGDLWYFGSATPTYDVISAIEPPTPEQLRKADGAPLRGARAYLQLPPLSARIKRLADSLTANAPTEYDKVVAIQNWLRTFRYTLELPATAREATLEYFLFRRRAGHCEYFSTAMAVLLREVGIPARNVNGFLGGDWNDFGQFLTVTQNQAHSWTEVFFPGYGWVTFDGTPAAAADFAEQADTWNGPFRKVFDGFEHRWDKWILEYNLEKQVNLFARVTEPFARRDSGGRVQWNPAIVQVIKVAFIAGVLLLLIMAIVRRGKFDTVGWEGRVYLRLRRQYEKAGYSARRHDAPAIFVEKMRQQNAPGVDDAQRAIDLYLRSRFGGEELSDDSRRELREAAQRARKALRAA